MKLQIITLILAGFALNGMERDLESSHIHEQKKADIAVTNNTNWKLVLNYNLAVYGEGKPFQSVIVPNQTSKFQKVDLEQPITLTPYGQRLEYTQINQPQDLSREIKKLIFDPEKDRIKITVQQASKAASWLSGRGTLGSLISQAISPIEGLVSAFEISIKTARIEKNEEEIKDVIDAFPAVASALASGKQPLARYYLNLPEGANQDSVDKQYLNLKETFSKLNEEFVKKSLKEKNDRPNIFPVILRILELAHNALTAELQLKEASDILIAKK